VGLQAQAFAPRPFIYLFKGMYDLSFIAIFFFKKKRHIPNTLAVGAKIPATTVMARKTRQINSFSTYFNLKTPYKHPKNNKKSTYQPNKPTKRSKSQNQNK